MGVDRVRTCLAFSALLMSCMAPPVAGQSAETEVAEEEGAEQRLEEATPEEVRAVLRSWDEALFASDVDALGRLLEDDVALLPAGRPTLEGREAVLDAYRALFAQYEVRRELEVIEIEIAGDWAFVRGTETFELRTAGSGDTLQTDSRRVLSLLRRDEEGVWRFARAMTNRKTVPALEKSGADR